MGSAREIAPARMCGITQSKNSTPQTQFNSLLKLMTYTTTSSRNVRTFKRESRVALLLFFIKFFGVETPEFIRGGNTALFLDSLKWGASCFFATNS